MDLLGRDAAFVRLLGVARRAAPSSVPVLITGETGTGKTALARYLHASGPRREAPLVEVSCSNLAPELAESELFGHARGSFTGAFEERAGRFELAHGGTLLLDDLEGLAPQVQSKVLRAVELKQFERLGETRTRRVNVRILACTREDPETLVRTGRLREDLLFRLDGLRLNLPPLRERRDDLDLLADRFLEESCRRHGLEPRRLSAAVRERIHHYPWPGNVRELRHVMEACAILSEGPEVLLEHLPAGLSAASARMLSSAAARGATLAELERAYILEVLRRTRGNKSAAARILGIHRKTLYEKLRAMASDRHVEGPGETERILVP